MLKLYYNGTHGCQASGLSASVSAVLSVGQMGGMDAAPNQGARL